MKHLLTDFTCSSAYLQVVLEHAVSASEALLITHTALEVTR